MLEKLKYIVHRIENAIVSQIYEHNLYKESRNQESEAKKD